MSLLNSDLLLFLASTNGTSHLSFLQIISHSKLFGYVINALYQLVSLLYQLMPLRYLNYIYHI